MANLLAIESSAALCSIALQFRGKVVVREAEGERSHTQFMLPFIDELLQEQQCRIDQLDAIVFAAGPGSFTGVRLATSVAKALAYAAGIPVIPVSSLAAIAQTVARVTASTAPCLVITDARMGELYVAEYAFDANGVAIASCRDALLASGKLQLQQYQSARIAGGDAGHLLQACEGIGRFAMLAQPAHARDLLLLGEREFRAGETSTALAAEAIYLRGKSSWKNIEQQKSEKQAR